MTERKQYSDGVKAEAVRMVVEHGLSLSEASRQLTIPKGTLATWVRHAVEESSSDKDSPGTPNMATMMAENARLHKELQEARMERDILKKATAYFARESLHGTHS
ncbi:MAG: transposase [Rectinemataceae bacterium]|nr:transposase [Rectinemataceae bacterium]